MVADNVERAALLVRALREWSEFSEAAGRTEPQSQNYSTRIFEMQFGDGDLAGGDMDVEHYLTLDAETGRKIIASACLIIKEELKAIGVEDLP